MLEPRERDVRALHAPQRAHPGDADVEIDACRQHTEFYSHSLGQYVEHFAGRDATYVTADAPASSADGGTARSFAAALGRWAWPTTAPSATPSA